MSHTYNYIGDICISWTDIGQYVFYIPIKWSIRIEIYMYLQKKHQMKWPQKSIAKNEWFIEPLNMSSVWLWYTNNWIELTLDYALIYLFWCVSMLFHNHFNFFLIFKIVFEYNYVKLELTIQLYVVTELISIFE